MRKDSIDFEARELLRNKVLGSPAKQERVHGLGDGHRSSLGSCNHGGHSQRLCPAPLAVSMEVTGIS